MLPSRTYIRHLFQPPSVPGWQLHDLRLESLFRRITSNWFRSKRWLIIRGYPGGNARFWYIAAHIGIYCYEKLVVKMFDKGIGGHIVVDAEGEFILIKVT